MTSMLCVAKVSLEWADNQYWITLFNVVGEVSKLYAPKEKKPISTSEASKYIRRS